MLELEKEKKRRKTTAWATSWQREGGGGGVLYRFDLRRWWQCSLLRPFTINQNTEKKLNSHVKREETLLTLSVFATKRNETMGAGFLLILDRGRKYLWRNESKRVSSKMVGLKNSSLGYKSRGVQRENNLTNILWR